MRARFQGGELDGRPFDFPKLEVPPRGLDVRHGERVLRYRFETSRTGEAVYSFASESRARFNSTRVIDLGGAFSAVPLQYYPTKKG